jgi:hypothetical protein
MNRRDFLTGAAAGTAAMVVRHALGDDVHHHHDSVPQHNQRIHSSSTHNFHAQVNNGKVSGVNAVEKRTGKVQPHHRKVRSMKRHSQAFSSTDTVHHIVFDGQESTAVGDVGQLDILYVGFLFMLFGITYIFWWPVALVDGGDYGAEDYNG